VAGHASAIPNTSGHKNMQTERPYQKFRAKRHISFKTRLYFLCLITLLKVGWCSAATHTWNGSVSSDWFTAGNWTPSGVPGTNDIVNVATGTVSLTSAVTIYGTFNWSGGSLSGDPMTIESGGMMNITGTVALENVVTNKGTVTMTGAAYINVFNQHNATYNGGIYNLAGALWDIQTNATIYNEELGGEFFYNAGTLSKSAGSDAAGIYVPLTNTATVTNVIGALNFYGGGPLTGGYGVAADATIDFVSGNYSVGATLAISGLGLCEFTGTTLTIPTNVTSNLVLAGGSLILGPEFQNHGAITNLTLSGPTLTGANTVTGLLTWENGTLTGPITIESGGLLNITGTVELVTLLTNKGTVTMTGAAYINVFNQHNATYNGGIYNLAGALWDIQTNATIYNEELGGEFFYNAGTMSKSGGAATTGIYVPFTNSNSGTVNALVGTLSFYHSLTNLGGTLAFGVSSLASFGQINVSGEVALNGTASVTWLDGYLPHVGNAFALLDYGSHSGTFTNIFLASGYLGQGNYSNTFFSVLITNKVTTTNSPFLSLQHGSDSTVVLSWPTSAGDFTLQTRTNLASGSWSNVTSGITILGTNNVYSNTVGGQAAFFRLLSP
jgi:hypothetical protein